MKARVLSHISRWGSKHPALSVLMLTAGALVVLAEPAVARVTANHSETLVDDVA